MPARIFEDKICPVCKISFNRKTFQGGTFESTSNFLKREFCSQKCWGLRPNPNPNRKFRPRVVLEDKICPYCGISFNRKMYPSGKLEDPAAFRRRRFCSHACSLSFATGPNNHRYIGETYLTDRGYVRQSASKLIHRLVMEKYLGRKLEPWEVVHHADGRKDNNFISNLEVMTRSEHTRLHVKSQPRINGRRFGKCEQL